MLTGSEGCLATPRAIRAVPPPSPTPLRPIHAPPRRFIAGTLGLVVAANAVGVARICTCGSDGDGLGVLVLGVVLLGVDLLVFLEVLRPLELFVAHGAVVWLQRRVDCAASQYGIPMTISTIR